VGPTIQVSSSSLTRLLASTLVLPPPPNPVTISVFQSTGTSYPLVAANSYNTSKAVLTTCGFACNAQPSCIPGN
jgi:ABC-type Fe2+-enterobactin transport system substrate-binding protein